MYGMVAYQLTGEQSGIQFAHALTKYAYKYHDNVYYKDWVENVMTKILLNGGTTNEDGSGTLQQHIEKLISLGVDVISFQEPDLNNATTAICFLVKEQVWNKDKFYVSYNNNLSEYPSFEEIKSEYLQLVDCDNNGIDYRFVKSINDMGGLDTLELRNFLSKFKLAGK